MPVKVECLTGKYIQRAVEGFNEEPHARLPAQSLRCVTTFSFFYRTPLDHCEPSYEHWHLAQDCRKKVMREVAENRRVWADTGTKTCTLRIDLFTQQTCVSRSEMGRGRRESS